MPEQLTQAEMIAELRRLRAAKLFVGNMAYVDALLAERDVLFIENCSLRTEIREQNDTILTLEGDLSLVRDQLKLQQELVDLKEIAARNSSPVTEIGEEVQAEVDALGPAGVVALDPPMEEGGRKGVKPMNISKAARRVLEFLRDNAEEDDLILEKGGGYMMGTSHIAGRTVNELLRLRLISEDSFSQEDIKHFYINSDGRAVLKDVGHLCCMVRALYGRMRKGKKCLAHCSHRKI
jgi:hypothetical protein